ncbi:MAG TPA: hypothetical protein VFT90_03060 [Chryseosolibacter sp.]|nr:hypothetical protein [Chryseosolibacter sp.]
MKSRKHRSPNHKEEDRKRNDALNKGEKGPGEKSLPGEYPANEDIMNRKNTRRVGMDVENFSRMVGTENLNINEPIVTNPNDITDEPITNEEDVEDRRDHVAMEHPIPKDIDSDEFDTSERSESDVTEEDLQALGPKDLSMDMGEDERLLKNRVWPVDMVGSDLDVPGSELDDGNEEIGSEDEENNNYSLGGDRHEDNMEGK